MKTCLRCTHLSYMEGDPGYSELTPGTNMGMECTKRHWQYDQFRTSLEELTAMIEQAETCPDWTPR